MYKGKAPQRCQTSFGPLLPFLICPSPLKSSFTASKAALPLAPETLSSTMLSDTKAKGEMSIALRKGMGTVLPAAQMDHSYKDGINRKISGNGMSHFVMFGR